MILIAELVIQDILGEGEKKMSSGQTRDGNFDELSDTGRLGHDLLGLGPTFEAMQGSTCATFCGDCNEFKYSGFFE